MDVGVFQETNLTARVDTQGLGGYRLVAASIPRRHFSGIILFYWDSPNFAVEMICQFGANVIMCQLATRERRWYIVKCYLTPVDGVTIQDVEAVMTERPRGAELIVEG